MESINIPKPPLDTGCCVVSDFNEIMSQDEKYGGRERNEGQMEMFRRALEDARLPDLGWRGNKFTRCNGHGDEAFIKERLDCAIGNQAWVNCFLEVGVEILVVQTTYLFCLTVQWLLM